ncbi:MAG: hypothetical protein A3F17_04185 [Gammaproteobacteria bacterium RIFCSPHIGHO2_12_FULL_41_15]|nr:MAG: hypothetical protein A3F17_04185 [Gammaproteobacteria bacterium RIFCSPHIGHO2_12_FULL_41_15]
MNPQARKQAIIDKLTATLHPIYLDVIDESYQHIGHAGAKDGRSHFAINIVSPVFTDKPKVARHQFIYGALGDLMTTDIHALRIIAAKAPEE